MSRKKIITVQQNGVQMKCIRVKVPGDGACLFSALSFLMFQTISMAAMVRSNVVAHVVKNWTRFHLQTVNQYLIPYSSVLNYQFEMSKSQTYGSNCELLAASEIYNYKFQLFSISNGNLIADFEPPGDMRGIRRLGFSGDYKNGHFDVLIPVDEYNSWHFDENALLSTKSQKKHAITQSKTNPSAGTSRESRKKSTGNQKRKKGKNTDKILIKCPTKLNTKDVTRKEVVINSAHGYYLRQWNT